MNPIVNAVANRLSLRTPQRQSLEILSRLCEILSLDKGEDAAKALEVIKSEFPSVADFEREFPSLCFALATGVGKTRLMGAFIAYLYRAENVSHFFVLAPNLTIYNKLIADFTPNTPKYVFQGISEFAMHPPEIITGETYESGHGVRNDVSGQMRMGFAAPDSIHINIFNISKINSEVRGGAAPRIKRLSEYIGQSYFEYLSKLDDLVLIMDEAHRYRASAGIKAINELKPILGLELTATPQVETGGASVAFKNVIYSYPLSNAMTDGFVKEPAVATRKDFDARKYDEAALERIKLEDGVHIHEQTKVELEVYARENGKDIVKPFVLVVAKDTDHANALMELIEGERFFEGRYKGKVITVHSNQRGEEKDETVEQLMHVEKPDNPIEIVIHVNMLKEGWDVTNLYTIVPLRAANSRTLVEQSIGRGLRLPYGKRTGVPAVDRLTIVSHDKFQEIVDYANSPDSVIRGGMQVVYISDERSKVVESVPEVISHIFGSSGGSQNELFPTEKKREVAKATFDIIREFEKLPRSADLKKPEIQQQIVARVKECVAPAEMEIEGVFETIDYEDIVTKTIDLHTRLSIDIPRITLVPVGTVTRGYKVFTLNLANVRLQPVSHEILIQELHQRERYSLMSGSGIVPEERPEDYLVRGLMDFDDICYDDHAPMLYNLSDQVVKHLRSYLKNDEELLNVLQHHQKALVTLIHTQMQDHFEDKADAYVATATSGFTTLRPNSLSVSADEEERSFRVPVENLQAIRKMVFSGFKKCLYSTQKFDSDTERRFSVILENDTDVLKWFKPAAGALQIHYKHQNQEHLYKPDFIIETNSSKYVCETKAANEMDSSEVMVKAKAATEWCGYASEHELKQGGKPWTYVLIPHNVIADNKSLAGLVNDYGYVKGVKLVVK